MFVSVCVSCFILTAVSCLFIMFVSVCVSCFILTAVQHVGVYFNGDIERDGGIALDLVIPPKCGGWTYFNFVVTLLSPIQSIATKEKSLK